MNDKRRRRTTKRPEQITGTKKVLVHSSLFEGGKKVSEGEGLEEIDIIPFESEPAYIRVGAGVTKNLGDYESLRVDVSISMPCYPERIDETYEDTAEKVAELLETEVDNYMK